MNDPMSVFDGLPNWPGKTPPRNRGVAKDLPTDVQDLNGARSKTYRVKGIDREFFTVGELARALSRQPVTIRMWEQRGWIPATKYRTPPPAGEQIPGNKPRGRRLYSREQVVFLVDAVKRFRLDNQHKADWPGFKTHTRANWPA